MEKEKPHYLNHRKRLKERFAKAPNALPDAEIVELLLGYVIRGRDVKPQSKEIISVSKNLSSIFSTNLLDVKGVGEETALFFEILKEFYSRCSFQKAVKSKITMDRVDTVFEFLRHKIGHGKKETFAILFLDIKNNLKDYKIVREGFVSSVSMSARDIIEESMKKNAVRVIIAHNHPSGDCTPSNADLTITKQICYALQYTGVSLLDHIIVSSHDYFSMNATGYIEKFQKEIIKSIGLDVRNASGHDTD